MLNIRRLMLLIGLVWGLLAGRYQTTISGSLSPLSWPFLLGQQVFYYLGLPAVPPVYFYVLGVGLWMILFAGLGALLENLRSRLGTKKRKQRVREY